MAASKKRRSSFFPQRNNHNDSFNETPYIDDANVDEETERKNRMKLQKRQSIGPGAIAPATPNVENNAGKTALNLAEDQNYQDVVKILNARENKDNLNKEMIAAAADGRQRLVHALITAGANLETKDDLETAKFRGLLYCIVKPGAMPGFSFIDHAHPGFTPSVR